MPEIVNAQLTKLETLEKKLGQYIATAKGIEGNPDSYKAGTATQSETLKTVGGLLKITYVSEDIKSVGGEIRDALKTAALALRKVGDQLGGLVIPAGVNPADVVEQLQAALLMAQAVVPGDSSALTSGSQFFNQVSDLLKDVGNDIGNARTILYKVAQQFDAIAEALKP